MTRYFVSRRIEAEPRSSGTCSPMRVRTQSWNPAALGIEGEIRDGSKIEMTSIVNPDRRFKLDVSKVEPPHRMVWSDGMPLGLFRGERSFEVIANGDGTTEFTMEEVYSGLMAPLITKSIPDMTDSFEKFADGLKEAAESR